MNSEQALHAFWSSFGWKAIDEQSAYDTTMDIKYPYISYEVAVAEMDGQLTLNADLWDRSTSWNRVTEKFHEIAEYVAGMKKPIRLDKGYMWITEPTARRMAEDTGLADVRRYQISINVEFLTTYRR